MSQEAYITQYNEEQYNGVLFLMREANKGEKQESFNDVVRGNAAWLDRVIHYHYDHNTVLKNDDIPSAISRYGNRFAEILEALPIEDQRLESIAYVNINPSGGGNAKGKDYNDKLDVLDKRMKDIFTIIPKKETQFIITCRDAFDSFHLSEVQNGKGLKYKNGMIGRAGKKANEDIIYLEMIKHPCISAAFEKNYTLDIDTIFIK